MSVAGAFLRRDARIARANPIAFVFDVASLAFTAMTFALVARIVAPAQVPGAYLSFALAGLALATILSAGVAVVSANIRDEQVQGTLEATIVAGVSVPRLAAGMSAYPLAAALVRCALYVAIAAFLGARAPDANWPLAIVAALLGSVAFTGIGLIAAAGVLIVRQAGSVAVWFTSVATLVAGTVVPERFLPAWVRFIAQASPFTHALRVVRSAVLSGAGWGASGSRLALLAALAVLWIGLGLFALSAGLRWACSRGTLSRF